MDGGVDLEIIVEQGATAFNDAVAQPEGRKRGEIARYPDLSVPFPPFTTKQVEKAVRHLDIDPKLIGTDRAAGTVP